MKALILAALLLLTTLAVVPAADARPIEPPNCMPVYQRTDIETIAIVRPNSCTVHVYQCPYQGAPISSCERIV